MTEQHVQRAPRDATSYMIGSAVYPYLVSGRERSMHALAEVRARTQTAGKTKLDRAWQDNAREVGHRNAAQSGVSTRQRKHARSVSGVRCLDDDVRFELSPVLSEFQQTRAKRKGSNNIHTKQ